MNFRPAVFVILLMPAGAAHAQTGWTELAPPGAGFSASAPGAPHPSAGTSPNTYWHDFHNASFIVRVDAQTDAERRMLGQGDREASTKFLEALRDGTVGALNGQVGASSLLDFEGHPSILFSFHGHVETQALVGRQRIVLADGTTYSVVALGGKSELKEADIDRFLGSFHLRPAPPSVATNESATPGAFRTVSFTDTVCDRIPPMPIAFEMPADFISRRAPLEGGCLWGTKDDLDRVTADPQAGDFTALRRGVLRARVSTNVNNDPRTGVFDPLDGTGEAGIRRELERAGAKVAVFRNDRLAGHPALQIVADVGRGGRVYMLYLGNTGSNSNAMLLNYHPPQKPSADDDALWARFVRGIKATTDAGTPR